MQPAIDGKSSPTAIPTQQPSLRPGYWRTLSAEELVEHCRRGEPEAFDALMRRYERPIYNLAYRLTGNYDDALDITQEAFLRIYCTIGSFQSAITLPTWINRIVANIYCDTWRRAYRRPSVSLEGLVEKAGDTVLNAGDHRSVSPHSHAEENERKLLLVDALASLPDDLRTVIHLFHNKGQSYEEIADSMRMPVGTVKSRMYRARLALRKRLAPERAAFMD